MEYHVTVPRGARIAVKNVNGAVELDAVEGGARAATVNGSVEAARMAGAVDASTVNGSVQVSMSRVDPETRNRLDTTNGTVRLTLPRDASADVAGRHRERLGALRLRPRAGASVSRRKLEGRIGQGGARFELRTVNGSASIDRGLSTGLGARGSAPPDSLFGGRPTPVGE